MFGARASALRVKVKKCEGNNPPEWRKFSVDPQITSLEVLYSLLAKAFELNQDFGISYKTINPQTNAEQFLIILSDWDLEAAFLRSHNQSVSSGLEPCLNLQIDVKLFSEAPDWDANINNSATSTLSALTGGMTNVQQAGQKYVQNVQNKLPGLSGFLQGQIEKSFSIMTRALNFVDDPSMNSSPRPPLTDNEFRYYCDSVGQIIHQNELRKVIYSGGIDGSLRRVVWKHILNVYPGGLTGKERMDYIKRKSMEYISMREVWRLAVQQGTAISGELAYVTSMVRKDVLRTDRLHPFYSGSDDNQNIGALFNVLTTYALNHPSVSYCQGMSDIASPLLVTMCDEAQAYICFCAIMSRMKNNFMIDGIAMTQNFAHLSEAIQYYDMEFYNYLKLQQADDLLFCYRWLLLEMKREFAFEDSLRCLEVMWSSLPPNPPDKELQLFEKEFVIVETEPVPERTENPYTKLCALRRQNSAISLSSNPITINQLPKLDNTKRMNQSLDETIMNDVVGCKKEMKKSHQSLDETKILLLRQKNILNGESSPGIYENCEMLNSDCKTESSIDDISEHTEKEKNPFLYSDSSVDKDEMPSPENSNEISLVSKEKVKSIGGHFKDLKDKLAAGKKGIMTTIEKLESDYDPVNIPTNEVKLVKNFNEFLNFASGTKKDISPTTGDEKKPSISNAVDSNKSRELTDEISPDDSQDYFPMTTSITRDLKIEMDNLNRQVFGQNYHQFKAEVDSPQESYGESPVPVKSAITNISYIQLDHQKSASLDAIEVDNEEEVKGKVKMRKRELNEETALNRFSVASSTNNDVFIWQNPLHGSSDCILSHIPMTPSPANATTPDEHDELEYDGEIIEMDHGKKSVTPIRMLRKKRDVNDKTLTSEVDSDSEDENEKKWSHEHQLKLNSNNPFFDQIQQMSAKEKSEEEVLECGGQMNSCEEASEISNNSTTVPNEPKQTVPVNNQQPEPVTSTRSTELPPPHEFGNGNPFLMFLCLTLLIQHRDYIMKTGMDYNEMAMHFDKMVRKHNVTRVLSQARRLYQDYLRSHNERLKQTTINSTKI
ncbi:unnamed protein product [Diamesa hyperborea]